MADDGEQSEEAALVRLAQVGDATAFRELVERYDRRLLYYIRRILDDSEEAFDVLQEVWLRAHRGLRKLNEARAFRVWIYRIAHDQAISALRRTRPNVAIDAEELGEIVEDDSLDITERAEVVHAALRALSLDHRRVLTLRFLEDMSVDEIADVLGLSAGTVKSRLFYAKAAVRRWLEERGHA